MVYERRDILPCHSRAHQIDNLFVGDWFAYDEIHRPTRNRNIQSTERMWANSSKYGLHQSPQALLRPTLNTWSQPGQPPANTN